MNNDLEKTGHVMLAGHILHRSLCLEEPNNFNDSLYLQDLIYLSILLERLVLHEKMVLFDHPNMDEECFYQTEGKIQNDESSSYTNRLKNSGILKDLLEAGIFEIHETDCNSDLERGVSIMMRLEKDGFDDTLYEAVAVHDLTFAHQNGFSFVSDHSRYTRTAQHFLRNLESRTLSMIEQAYTEVSDGLRDDLLRLSRAGAQKTIYIPPLAAIILNRADSVSRIAETTLEVRDEFSSLRKSVSQYEQRICDDSLPIKESLDALNELERAVKAVTYRGDSSVATHISEWKDLADLCKVIDGISANDTASLTKIILGNPIKVLSEKLKKRKVNYLSSLQNEFFSIRNYGKLAEKLFGREITEEHVKVVQTSSSVDLRGYILK